MLKWWVAKSKCVDVSCKTISTYNFSWVYPNPGDRCRDSEEIAGAKGVDAILWTAEGLGGDCDQLRWWRGTIEADHGVQMYLGLVPRRRRTQGEPVA